MVFVGREREDHRPRCEKPGPGVIPTGGTEKNKCVHIGCFEKSNKEVSKVSNAFFLLSHQKTQKTRPENTM